MCIVFCYFLLSFKNFKKWTNSLDANYTKGPFFYKKKNHLRKEKSLWEKYRTFSAGNHFFFHCNKKKISDHSFTKQNVSRCGILCDIDMVSCFVLKKNKNSCKEITFIYMISVTSRNKFSTEQQNLFVYSVCWKNLFTKIKSF